MATEVIHVGPHAWHSRCDEASCRSTSRRPEHGETMLKKNDKCIPLRGGFEREGGTRGAMSDILHRYKP